MDIRALLKSAGLPKDLLTQDIGVAKNYPELLDLWDILYSKTTTRVVFVYGSASPKKDRLCAVLLKSLMESRSKKGLWLTPTRIPATQFGEGSYSFPPAGVTAVMGVDLLSPAQVKILVGHIRDQIPEDRCFILEVSSKQALEDVIGRQALAYLCHYAVALELTTEKVEPITVIGR